MRSYSSFIAIDPVTYAEAAATLDSKKEGAEMIWNHHQVVWLGFWSILATSQLANSLAQGETQAEIESDIKEASEDLKGKN